MNTSGRPTRYELMDTPSILQQLSERVTVLEAEREAERPHLATKADISEVRAEIALLRRDMRWGLLLLAIIAAGEWIPHARSLF